jgi:hypothetical protein
MLRRMRRSRAEGLDKRNLVKKLCELEHIGILKSEKKANLRLFILEQKFPLFKEYQKIVLKTVGIEERLKQIIKDMISEEEFRRKKEYLDFVRRVLERLEKHIGRS